ncbi:9814_t:CDS:2 [Acaulospora colombiana]|uniref:9814_t:CDS:1 n=1 Tax=Acaulospora colombiana TaxID=27376 RepID=A0ACA9MIS8_9GLOM|nr:9814_t:CDS:2 [Acaulospora colombiana]
MSSPAPTVISTVTELIATTTISTIQPTKTVYDRDPYLDYQPAFAYSLPVQFLLTGAILAVCIILLIHLVFTVPYHWPLARLNYVLQMAGVCSLLLNLGITLSVILSDVHATSREWPYMLNYVAVDVPLTNWTQVGAGWWYALDAVTSGLAHKHGVPMAALLFLVAKVPPVWVPPLLWGVVLWQSFLGWWWYVGSAAPEPPPRVRSKKKRKGKGRGGEEGTRLGRVKTRLGFGDGDNQKLRRRARTGEANLNASSSQERDHTRNSRSSSPDWSSANEKNQPLPPKAPPTIWSSMANRIPDVIWSWFHRLRQEHRNAAELQAVENEQKRFEVYGDERSRGVPGSGWGLGSYALRADPANEEYDRHDRSRSNRLPDETDDNDIELRNMGDSDDRENRAQLVWDEEEERRRSRPRNKPTRPELQRLSTPGTSWSWKGPFQKWRLRDASTY